MGKGVASVRCPTPCNSLLTTTRLSSCGTDGRSFPVNAVHPAHGGTFGHVRDLLVEEMNNEESDVHALGCLGDKHARQLDEAQCEPGSRFCWHRCMFHEDHGVSKEICGVQDLNIRCTDPRYQLYNLFDWRLFFSILFVCEVLGVVT